MLPMPLTHEEVEHIAELAKLELNDEELGRFREQLSAVLDYAADFQKVDTSAIPPTATVLPLRSVLREDTVKPSLDRAALLANADEQELGCFKVPAVLE
jgi:aspartyl-tRNA(Asn)/glutamyl-tRNA(Gln) amidotransferase subunit C